MNETKKLSRRAFLTVLGGGTAAIFGSEMRKRFGPDQTNKKDHTTINTPPEMPVGSSPNNAESTTGQRKLEIVDMTPEDAAEWYEYWMTENEKLQDESKHTKILFDNKWRTASRIINEPHEVSFLDENQDTTTDSDEKIIIDFNLADNPHNEAGKYVIANSSFTSQGFDGLTRFRGNGLEVLNQSNIPHPETNASLSQDLNIITLVAKYLKESSFSDIQVYLQTIYAKDENKNERVARIDYPIANTEETRNNGQRIIVQTEGILFSARNTQGKIQYFWIK